MTITTTIQELISLAEEYERRLPDLVLPGDPLVRPISDWIDHTLLKPEATRSQVEALCAEAARYHFASVCINPVYIPLATQALGGSGVPVCTVIGFPLGATLTGSKAAEAQLAIEAGAREVDMVVAIGLLRGGEYAAVMDDIAAVVETAHSGGALVKVILEMALLDRRQKIMGCLLSKMAGVEFVKTSTGFGPGGATLEDVELMRRVVGSKTGVKAAGGIRSFADARAMLLVGATRLGTSAGVKIVQEAEADGQEKGA